MPRTQAAQSDQASLQTLPGWTGAGVPLIDFDRIRELSPEPSSVRPEFPNDRGAACQARGDLGGALVDFDRALERNPGCAEGYNYRGAIRQARGDLTGALADFNRALELNPGYAEAYNNRGVVRQARGDLDGALADYDRALELTPSPDAAPIYHNRGAARRGNFDGAIADFSRALAIDPGYCAAYISRGNARYHQWDPGCEADYRFAFCLDARLAAREIVRLLDEGIGPDPADVLADCRQHLRSNPEDALSRVRRGLTHLLLNQDTPAIHDLQRVFLRSPAWKPFLPLLIDEAKRRRAAASARMTGSR
jgi:tetratricopeptide (TPR) repeat protein